MSTRFDPCKYEEEMLDDLAGMQRVRLQEYGGSWWEWYRASLLVRLQRISMELVDSRNLHDIEVKCADIANYAAMISADARRSS